MKNLGKRQIPREGDSYNEDGILICGRCGAPREWHGFFPGVGETFAPCVCHCDRKRNAESERERAAEDRKKTAMMRRNWAFPEGETMAKCSFERDDGRSPEATKAVLDYAKNIRKNVLEGNCLLLYGNVGTGKSFLAAAALNRAIDEGFRCLFISFPRVINELGATFDKNGYIRELLGYDFIVFDDLGVERNTEYVNEQVYQIINARYLARKAMIVTTNMDNAELCTEDMSKKRIISRILERAEVVAVRGEDRRTERFRR